MKPIQDRIINRYREIKNEWEKHKTMNTCSICDSPKCHTSMEQFILTSIKLVQEETRKEVVEECKQKMAQSNEWWNKKLLSLTQKEKQK